MSKRYFDWDKFWSIVIGGTFWGGLILIIFWSPITNFFNYLVNGNLTCSNVSIPFEKTTTDAGWLEPSESYTSPGVEGSRKICYYKNGKIISNTITSKPSTEVYYKGTFINPHRLSNPDSGSGAMCKDGTYTPSTGSGTCSWHHGIDYYL